MYSLPVIFMPYSVVWEGGWGMKGLALVAGEILPASILATQLRPALRATAEAEGTSNG